MAAQRNTQIDGWRAFAVLGVMWLHWAPREWRGVFPFEIGLFFFLTLTGFLITRILLKEGEAVRDGTEGGFVLYGRFLRRRFGRVVLPCVVAMLFALVVGAPDIREHPWWYFLQGSNYHMAMRETWPSGTAPFWSLAIQMQFYVAWPLLVLWLPRVVLPYVFASGLVVAPLSRWVLDASYPEVYHAGAIPLCAMDYFGAGALLAWALACGWSAGHRGIQAAACAGLGGYVVIYVADACGSAIPFTWPVQQTFLAVGMAGLIGLTLRGFPGWAGAVLTHPAVQHVGRISYGLYLFHAAVPLLLGKIMPFLWMGPAAHEPWMLAVRIVMFGLASWGIACLCWKYLEAGGKR